MLGNILGKMIDVEKQTYNTIKDALNSVLAELNEGRELKDHYTSKDFFLMIRPTGVHVEDGETEVESMKFFIYKLEHAEGKMTGMKIVREITLKEILGIET